MSQLPRKVYFIKLLLNIIKNGITIRALFNLSFLYEAKNKANKAFALSEIMGFLVIAYMVNQSCIYAKLRLYSNLSNYLKSPSNLI